MSYTDRYEGSARAGLTADKTMVEMERWGRGSEEKVRPVRERNTNRFCSGQKEQGLGLGGARLKMLIDGGAGGLLGRSHNMRLGSSLFSVRLGWMIPSPDGR